MLRKLRLKFICINMAIVTAMLCVIFSLVLNSTAQNLESQSISALKQIADNPTWSFRPDREPGENTRIPISSSTSAPPAKP